MKDLQMTLTEMRRLYVKDPVNAVRGQHMIRQLHAFSIRELKRLGVSEKKVLIKKETKIFGAHKAKKVDVAVIHEEAGPLIIISIRSQMSSFDKNFKNYIEGLSGEAANLHEAYPNLVVGLIYILPKETIQMDSAGRREIHDLQKKEKLFKPMSYRKDAKDSPSKFEHIAYLAVDFVKDPPEVLDIPSDPTLRIENFYYKLLKTYRERNPFLDILEP